MVSIKSILVFFFILSFSWANTFEKLEDTVEVDSVRLYNPYLTTSLSLIPGAGQIYTKHYTKGGIFFATELLMGTQSLMRWRWYHQSFDTYYAASKYYDSTLTEFNKIPDSSVTATDSTNLALAYHSKYLSEFDIEKSRIDYINWSTWFGGIFLWNLIDAAGVSNRFDGVDNPSPKRAALLSAIPFTGAGQFYNGQFFKGAMVSVVEIACMVSAINLQGIMNLSEEYPISMKAENEDLYNMIPYANQQEWNGRFDNAARTRTMFMWYGVIFYLYGIVDAMVDAHLHNFDSHFKITANVSPIDKSAYFAFAVDIGGWKQ